VGFGITLTFSFAFHSLLSSLESIAVVIDPHTFVFRDITMSSPTGLVIPPGYSPPFATITPDDHAAWILIAAALGLACYLFFGIIRVVVRITISHGFALDDYVLGAATLLAVIESSLVLGACSKGLGKSAAILSSEAQEEVQKIYYTSSLFYILAIGLSKISVICFLSRISRMKQHRLVFNIAMGLITLWTIGSFLAMALQCNISAPWIIESQSDCSGTVSRVLFQPLKKRNNTDETRSRDDG
jgi:hypothetical protein